MFVNNIPYNTLFFITLSRAENLGVRMLKKAVSVISIYWECSLTVGVWTTETCQDCVVATLLANARLYRNSQMLRYSTLSLTAARKVTFTVRIQNPKFIILCPHAQGGQEGTSAVGGKITLFSYFLSCL
jgi:hypothetical protein